MRYLPHTDKDIAAMMKKVGISDLDELFASIPTECRHKDELNLPNPLDEWELNRHMDELASRTAGSSKYKVFIGAGAYDHYIPAVIPALLSRGEFLTAYTPYQPEISQGTLQAIFEYQTLTARLLGMDVANASMYDGASALAEALLMGIRATRRKRVAISEAIHPFYRRVAKTYLSPAGYEIVEIPYLENGKTDLSKAKDLEDIAVLAVQSPNFFGCVEDIKAASDIAKSDSKTLLSVSFSEPLAYGLLKSPGELGADIACGEGQSFGVPISFGGPGLGMFAAKKKYLRHMPGRLIGKTVDKEGKRGFVLTLATREQHIRREKATSNICSNQGLCATACAMYMASLGGTGVRRLARLNFDKSEYLKKQLKTAGFDVPFGAPGFNEFVVKAPKDFKQTRRRLLDKKIAAGLPLEEHYPELVDHYLFCATETASKEDMDALVREILS